MPFGLIESEYLAICQMVRQKYSSLSVYRYSQFYLVSLYGIMHFALYALSLSGGLGYKAWTDTSPDI